MKSYTDLEQSKKLAEILPIESADLYYDIGFDNEYHIQMPTNGYFGNKRFFIQFPEAVPCWSLTTLLSLIKPVNDNSYTLIGTLDGGAMISFEEVTNVMFQEEEIIDAVFGMILKLHELKML